MDCNKKVDELYKNFVNVKELNKKMQLKNLFKVFAM